MAEYKIVVTTENGEEYTLSKRFTSRPKAAAELNDVMMHRAYLEGSQIIDGRIEED